MEPAKRLSALIDAEAVESQVCSWGASGQFVAKCAFDAAQAQRIDRFQ